MFANAQSGVQRLVQGQVTISRDGRERNLSVRVTTEQSADAEHGYVVTLDDITELVTAQRTSAWADVARRIAHEIKNPLTPIQLSAERLRRKYGKIITEDPAVFEQCTDTIVRQVDDIKRMVDEFSQFARMPKPVMAAEDVADTVRQVVFLMRVGNADIDIELETGRRPDAGALRPPADLAGAHQHHQERHRGDRARCRRPSAARGRIRVVGRARRRRHRHRRDRQRHRPAEGEPQPAARALCHDAREGHRPRPRHRRPDSGRARRRHRAARRRREVARASAAPGCGCASRPSRRQPSRHRANRAAANPRNGEQRRSWRPTFSSSTTKPISASWSRASCRTRATPRAPRATATTALSAIASAAAQPGVPRHLAAGQPARRAAAARHGQGAASRPAGGDDLRPRQHRDRGRGDQARRLRLHREAVQGRPAGAGRRPRAGNLAAQARGQGAQGSSRRCRRAWSAARRRSTSCARPSRRSRRPTAAS